MYTEPVHICEPVFFTEKSYTSAQFIAMIIDTIILILGQDRYLVFHRPAHTAHMCQSDSGFHRSHHTRNVRSSYWGRHSAT